MKNFFLITRCFGRICNNVVVDRKLKDVNDMLLENEREIEKSWKKYFSVLMNGDDYRGANANIGYISLSVEKKKR